MPRVSIIVATYNTEPWLSTCLQSVVDQTFLDWECVIVLDGCTDKSPAIAARFAEADSRFKVVNLAKNVGPGAARNHGLKVATGEFISFLDSDDYWNRAFLENLHLQLSQEPGECVGTFCSSKLVDESNQATGVYQVQAHNTKYHFLKLFIEICPMGNGSSLLLRRKPLFDAGPFRDGVCEDIEMWLRILRVDSNRYLLTQSHCLVHYRQRASSLTKRKDDYLVAHYSEYLERHIQGLPATDSAKVYVAFAQYILRFGAAGEVAGTRWARSAMKKDPFYVMSHPTLWNKLVLLSLSGRTYHSYLKMRQKVGQSIRPRSRTGT